MALPSDNAPGRRRRSHVFRRFLRQYFPSVILALLAVICVCVIVYTVNTVTGALHKPDDSSLSAESQPSASSPETALIDFTDLIAQADALAAGYDYLGAIALLQTVPHYEEFPELSEKIAQYTELDGQLISYSDMDSITHLCFKSLITDSARAFDGDSDSNQYNQHMVTIPEFEKILQSLYDQGFVLVSPYDIACETTDASGNAIFHYGTIRLPEGKTPFLLSQEDVNYYGYMIGTGSGVNETPVFADANGDGFASRIVFDENGKLACEYVDANGNITTGDYDLFLILERFIGAHPDFSYHGARGILAVSGYEGVFGYRTKPSYETALGSEVYAAEVESAKAVAQALKEMGWVIASNSYGNPVYGNISAERVIADSDKWEETVEPIVGETDILLFPHGTDIAGVSQYTMDDMKFAALYEDGYRYFFNVDSKVSWSQLGANYYRASRRSINGYRMYYYPEKFEDLFSVTDIFDKSRPTPVPSILG